jgi:hypothetical protein
MSMPSLSIKFRSEWGDHQAGAVVSFPEGLARHLVDSGLATFVAAPEPVVEPVIERADARPAKNVQRATK